MTKPRKLALVLAIAAVVITGFVLTALYMSWQMLDPPIVPFLAVGIPLTVIGSVLVVRRATGWRRRIGSFLGVSWIGIFTFAFVLFGFTGACNAWLDSSTPELHRVEILEKFRKRGSRRFVEVASWRRSGEREGMWLPADAVDHTDAVIVSVRSGFLGFAWISDVEPVK